MNNINYFIPKLINTNSVLTYTLNKINDNKCEINKWNIHKRMLTEIKQFKIKGILIYKNGINKIFLRFYLDHVKYENYKFIIYNLFGKKIIEFILKNNKIFIKKGENIIDIEENNKNLFEEKYKIPIKNLRSWLIGLPGDSKEFRLNKIGRLKEIEYINNSNKYIIKYYKYHNNINPPLPTNIEFSQGNCILNLKISNWTLS